MEVAPQYWQSPDTLKDIYVRSTNGTQVPLSAFTKFERSTTVLAVNHQGQFPAVTISFNLAPGVSLGDAVQQIDAAKREIGLPASIQAGFQGTAQAFQQSLANTPILVLAALATVYIVLGVLYESFVTSADDTVDSSFCGGGRDPGFVTLPHRTNGNRSNRNYFVDRHREEECDNDDRFRIEG
jgi:multidrug efflux pump subunit AcrB